LTDQRNLTSEISKVHLVSSDRKAAIVKLAEYCVIHRSTKIERQYYLSLLA